VVLRFTTVSDFPYVGPPAERSGLELIRGVLMSAAEIKLASGHYRSARPLGSPPLLLLAKPLGPTLLRRAREPP